MCFVFRLTALVAGVVWKVVKKAGDATLTRGRLRVANFPVDSGEHDQT